MTRKRLGGTSVRGEDSRKKKGEDTRKHRTSRMYRWRGNSHEPCGRTQININGLICVIRAS